MEYDKTYRLVNWHGNRSGVTIGSTYFIRNSDGVGVFPDDLGDPRAAIQGDWEELSFVDPHIEHSDCMTETFGPLTDDPLINPKKACGAVKAPMHTMPTLGMIEVCNVMAGGAHKYGYHNFRDSKIDVQTYLGAMNRHFLKFQDGIDFDAESGAHELAHLAACCMILIDAHYTGNMIDNRSKTGLVEGLLKKSEENFAAFVKANKSIEEKRAETNE